MDLAERFGGYDHIAAAITAALDPLGLTVEAACRADGSPFTTAVVATDRALVTAVLDGGVVRLTVTPWSAVRVTEAVVTTADLRPGEFTDGEATMTLAVPALTITDVGVMAAVLRHVA